MVQRDTINKRNCNFIYSGTIAMTPIDNSDTQMKSVSPPLLLTYQQTAQILGLGCRSIMYLADENKVERVYPRKRSPRITHASVLKFVELMSKNHTSTTCKDKEKKQPSQHLRKLPIGEKVLRKNESDKISINTKKLLNYLK